MGTRSLTRVFEDKDQLVCMYRHIDGYPSGHGAELAEFLGSGQLVNGLGSDSKNVFNGAGCLAAQMVAHFKEGPGGIYLYPTKTINAWQEYEYEIHVSDVITVKAFNCLKREIFEGNVLEFAAWCKDN